MRRLDDIVISNEDRPAPPRARRGKGEAGQTALALLSAGASGAKVGAKVAAGVARIAAGAAGAKLAEGAAGARAVAGVAGARMAAGTADALIAGAAGAKVAASVAGSKLAAGAATALTVGAAGAKVAASAAATGLVAGSRTAISAGAAGARGVASAAGAAGGRIAAGAAGLAADGRPLALPKPKGRKRVAPAWWRRSKPFAIAAVLLVAVALPALVLDHTGFGKRIVHSASSSLVGVTGRFGLTLTNVSIDGASRTSRAEVLEALQVKPGDPILGLDLDAMRDRLQAIAWVQSATLERRMPGQIHVTIKEREPIAIWQNQGHYMLIDGQGLPISPDIGNYRSLLLVVGDGAPEHAAALLAMLAKQPALAARVKAAQWVGDRRWNLEFDQPSGGIEVELPEDAPDAAWQDLAGLDRDHQILERKLTQIDMRLPDRYVLRPVPAPAPSAPSAKSRRKGGGEA